MLLASEKLYSELVYVATSHNYSTSRVYIVYN